MFDKPSHSQMIQVFLATLSSFLVLVILVAKYIQCLQLFLFQLGYLTPARQPFLLHKRTTVV